MKDVLSEVEDLEEAFDMLQVAFDSQSLARHRLHVLRKFGLNLSKISDDLSPEDTKRATAEALRDAYNSCVEGHVQAWEVFPGLKQEQLVTLSRKKPQ